jgi:hypothetical protein
VLVVVVAVPKRESHQKRFTASTVASCTRGLVVDMGVVVLVVVCVLLLSRKESHTRSGSQLVLLLAAPGDVVVVAGVIVSILALQPVHVILLSCSTLTCCYLSQESI